MLFGVLGLSVLALVWRSGRVTSFRRTWTRADWIGAVTLAVGGAVAIGSIASHRSEAWYVSTTFFQDRMIDLGLSAGGALAIGLGVVPLVAGLASLVRPKGEPPSPGVDALAIVTVSTIVFFGMYTAVKAVWLSTRLRDPRARAQPDLPRPIALRRHGAVPPAPPGALVGRARSGRSGALPRPQHPLLARPSTPTTRHTDSPSSPWRTASSAGRPSTIEHALVTVTICATLLLVLVSRVRSQRVAIGGRRRAGRVHARLDGDDRGLRRQGRAVVLESDCTRRSRSPPNWLDRRREGARPSSSARVCGDTNPVNLLEFWNRSLTKVWALDGTAPGPGATTTPNVDKPDGTLTDPGHRLRPRHPGAST